MQESRFFHVYNRGVERRNIFIALQDVDHLYSLMSRYLNEDIIKDGKAYTYPNYHNKIRIHAFCLMTNHFHFALEELEDGAMGKFMQSLKSAYCRYFNQKYNRTGVLFETKYKRRDINSTEDLLSLSRYVHLNGLAIQKDYWKYRHSSLQHYLGTQNPSWLHTKTIVSLITSPAQYLAFHEDYRSELAVKALAAIKV